MRLRHWEDDEVEIIWKRNWPLKPPRNFCCPTITNDAEVKTWINPWSSNLLKALRWSFWRVSVSLKMLETQANIKEWIALCCKILFLCRRREGDRNVLSVQQMFVKFCCWSSKITTSCLEWTFFRREWKKFQGELRAVWGSSNDEDFYYHFNKSY